MNTSVDAPQPLPMPSLDGNDAARGDYWWVGYWRGYRIGLRRARLGDAGALETEHRLWTLLAESDDPARLEIGRGYRDGLVAGERAAPN